MTDGEKYMWKTACLVVSVLSLLVPGVCDAKVTRIRTPEQAIKALRNESTAEEALAFLISTKDLFKKHKKALAKLVEESGTVSEVAQRIFSLVLQGKDGACDFAGSLISKSRPTWTRLVVERYEELPECEQLKRAVHGTLVWLLEGADTPENIKLLSKVLAIVRKAKDASVHKYVCKLVLSGPEVIRREAIETLLAIRADGAMQCLAKAYTEARAGKPCPIELRHALLEAIYRLGDVDAVATLIFALEEPADNAIACRLLLERGTAGIQSMIFAIKSSDAKAAGIGECLASAGDNGVAAVLELLDHPSKWVRQFAVDFLTKSRSQQVLAVLRERFDSGRGLIPRAVLLEMLAQYPATDVRDVLVAALNDPSAEVRLAALNAIERAHSLDYREKLLMVAEEDVDPAVRKRALEVMWRLGDEAVAPLALRMVQYEKPEVVPMAAQVLAFMGDQKAVSVLIPLLKSKEPAIAEAALSALWVLTFRDPNKGEDMAYRPEPVIETFSGEIEVAQGRVAFLGKKGPLVVVTPGGPGMDLSWARPWLDRLADEAVLAYVQSDETGLVSKDLLEAVLQAAKRDKAVIVSAGLGGTNALWLSMRAKAVTGVVVFAAPLPGRLQSFDSAILAAIEEPFASLAQAIVDDEPRFRPEALNRYMKRLMAPALAGPDRSPEEILKVRMDMSATAKAYSVLMRPEVDFQPTTDGPRVLWIGPVSTLSDDLKQALSKMAAVSTFTLVDMSDCGFVPTVTCNKKVLEVVEKFIYGVSR